MEPLAVGVFACMRANIAVGRAQKCMVTGAGPVGLLTAMAAKALGAQDLCILGKTYGNQLTINCLDLILR